MRAALHLSTTKTNNNLKINVEIMSERQGRKRALSPEVHLKQELELLKAKFRKLEEQIITSTTGGNNNRHQAADARAPDRSSLDEGYTSSDAANPPKSPVISDRQRNVLYAPPSKHANDSKVIKSNNKTPSIPEGSKDSIPRNKEIILTNKPPSSPTNIILSPMADGLRSVLQNGLPNVERYRLLEKYKTPSNCILMKTPIINPEVIPFMDEKAKKRDSAIFKNQDQLGAAMAAIAKGVTMASKSGEPSPLRSPEFRTAMEHINKGLHLLADLHYDQTKVRRILCTPINSRLKSFLVAKLSHRHHNFKDINHLFHRDDTVFGRDTGDMIKELLPIRS